MESSFRFTVEEVFSIAGRGVVVKGAVEQGSISLGDEVGFLGTDGKQTNALVTAIEVSQKLTEKAQAGQPANMLLEGIRKNQVARGTVLLEAPASAGPPPVRAPESPSRSTVSVPSLPSGRQAIHPSSGLGRTLFILGIGILVILALAFLDWK